MDANVDAWQIWLETCTQIRVNGGLDYSEVRETAKRLDVDMSSGMWKKIKVMEITAFDGGTTDKSDAERG